MVEPSGPRYQVAASEGRLLADRLAALNALMNLTSFVLLCAGYYFVRTRQIDRHRRTMLTAFAVSAVFLCSYLTRFALSGTHVYPPDAPYRGLYLFILGTHVPLAATVPVFALRGIFLGLKDRRAQHRRLMRIGLPIWLYVSVTGVLVYVLLYAALGKLPF
jgi:putative membrane protein